jgi:hypothetical protein
MRFVERLTGIGCGFALDDFGIGYGGFMYQREHSQREHGLAQARRDAHQEQLDQGQTGRDRRQAMLDVQQHELEVPVAEELADPQSPASADADRVRLAGERAQAARRRATEAVKRAEDAELRLAALAKRREE